jgi:hypothetical protein
MWAIVPVYVAPEQPQGRLLYLFSYVRKCDLPRPVQYWRNLAEKRQQQLYRKLSQLLPLMEQMKPWLRKLVQELKSWRWVKILTSKQQQQLSN